MSILTKYKTANGSAVHSLEDGEETVTEEVQPELTETDETTENSSNEKC